MSVEINCEVDDLRPVNEIIKARLGKRISPCTLWRWRLKGVNGARLECVRVGGIWCTTTGAFADFLRTQTATLSRPQVDDVPAELPASTKRRLAAAGLLETGR